MKRVDLGVGVLLGIALIFGVVAFDHTKAPTIPQVPVQPLVLHGVSPETPIIERPHETVSELKKPARIKYVAPVYPSADLKAIIDSYVILEVAVDADGNVTEAKVTRSTLFPALDQAAINAVKKWKYAPTIMNGVAVPVIFKVNVDFKLPDK